MSRDDKVNSPPQYNAMQYYDDGGGVASTPDEIPAAQFTPDTQPPSPDEIPVNQFKPDAASPSSPDEIPVDQFKPDPTTDFNSPGQQAIAGIEGGAEGILGPFAPALERVAGVSPENIRARAEANPWTHGLAKAGTLLGGFLTGSGEAGYIAKGAEAATSYFNLAKAAEAAPAALSANIGAKAIQGGIEGVLLASSDEATKGVLQDPDQTAGTVLNNIGLNGAIGGITGSVFGGIGALLARGSEPAAKLSSDFVQGLEDAKGQMAYRMNVPDPAEAMTNELSAFHNEVSPIYDETYGLNGTKAQAIAKAVPEETSAAMMDQAQDHLNTAKSMLAKMQDAPERYPSGLVSKFENAINDFEQVANPNRAEPLSETDQFLNQTNGVSPPEQLTPHPEDLFNATNQLKQFTAGFGKLDKYTKVTDPSKDFTAAMRTFGPALKEGLEDSSVWGDAARIQQGINSRFTKFKPFYDKFINKFTEPFIDSETGDISQVVSADKIDKYNNSLGTTRASVPQNILKGYVDNGHDFASYVGHLGEPGESSYTAAPLNVTRNSFNEVTTGMKAANAIVDKGLGEGTAKVAAGLPGAAIGGFLFGPWGAYGGERLSEHLLGPMMNKLVPLLGKKFFQQISKTRGFIEAGQYAESAIKGTKDIGSATANVFKQGAKILPLQVAPTISALNRLDAKLVASRDNPEQFAQDSTQSNLGHYLPEHALNMAAIVGNATSYLNAIRPDTSPKAPLDGQRIPSSTEQAQYMNALKIAENPLWLTQKIKEGSITPQDIQHITAINPAGWNQIKAQLASAMTDHMSKGNVVPYQTRIGLSLALGQPMDSTFSPAAIIASQPQGGQPQAPANAPKRGSKSSTKGLPKLANRYATPLQQAQAPDDE